MVWRPSLNDVTRFTLELLDGFDDLRLRYQLTRLWRGLPAQVQAVRVNTAAEPRECLVLDGALPESHQGRAWLWTRVCLGDFCGMPHLNGLTSERATHIPLDDHQALVGLCALGVRALRRYAEWVSPRRRVRLQPALQAVLGTTEAGQGYTDYAAYSLQRVVAQHALARLWLDLPWLRRYIGAELTPDGRLRRAGEYLSVPASADSLRVLHRVWIASGQPQPHVWVWLPNERCVRRTSDPLQAALGVLALMRGLVGGLTAHERLQVLEGLLGLDRDLATSGG